MNDTLKKQITKILERPTEEIDHIKLLEDFVWENTTHPRFALGDVVYFSDPSMIIKRCGSIIKGLGDMVPREEYRCVNRAIGRIARIAVDINKHTFRYAVEYRVNLEGGSYGGENSSYHVSNLWEEELTPAVEYRPIKWSEL